MKLSILGLFETESHIIDNGISPEEGKMIAKELNLNFEKELFSFEQFLNGANHEIEHKKEVDSSPTKIAQIVMDHLRENPDYYEQLKQIEEGIIANSPQEFFEKANKINSPGTIKLRKKKKGINFKKIKNRSGK